MKNIRIGGVNEHFNLPWIKLSEKNNLENLNISWESYPGGTGVLTNALRSKEIDMAILLTEGLLIDIIKNKELQFINFHVLNPLRWAIHVRDSDSDNLNFAGKTFAISRFGSGSHTMAKYLLVKNEINSGQVKFIEVGSLEGGLASLKNNEADIFLWEKFTTEPFLKDNNLKSIGEVLTPWPPFSIATSKSFANDNRKIIKEILAIVKMEMEQLLIEDTLIDELKMRWKITKENASAWMKEIKWNDFSQNELINLNHILDEMKKVQLINENETIASEYLFHL